MSIRLTKIRLAVAIAVIAALVPATAVATHVFDDVPDDKFYADAVEWAAGKGITTGTSPTTFHPDRGVTRGESVTFLKRYDDNVVPPALSAVQGIPGPQGDPGPKGDPGLAAWNLIPSGQTVTGVFRTDLHSTVDPADYRFFVSFPATAPSMPTGANFATDGSAATIDDDPTCTGTSANPTAPAGRVCVYYVNSGSLDTATADVFPSANEKGFDLRWQANGLGDMFLYAAWAYTAP